MEWPNDHQTRIRCRAIRQAERRLPKLRLSRVQDFHSLHSRISDAISDVPGIGALMVYDTALRIGARLGLEPEFVYLHAGTRAGARALAIDSGRPYLRVSELPEPLQTLRPCEIEDVLCIFKRHFVRMTA